MLHINIFITHFVPFHFAATCMSSGIESRLCFRDNVQLVCTLSHSMFYSVKSLQAVERHKQIYTGVSIWKPANNTTINNTTFPCRKNNVYWIIWPKPSETYIHMYFQSCSLVYRLHYMFLKGSSLQSSLENNLFMIKTQMETFF